MTEVRGILCCLLFGQPPLLVQYSYHQFRDLSYVDKVPR